MKEQVKEFLTKNWHLKLLALILAVVLWLLAKAWIGS